MLRKILTAIVVIPLALVMIALAVANRHSVTVSLDPFAGSEPAVSAKTAGQGPLWNAQLLGKCSILQLQSFPKRDQRSCRQSLANQLGEIGKIPNRASQNSAAASQGHGTPSDS